VRRQLFKNTNWYLFNKLGFLAVVSCDQQSKGQL
jgi:hypothetical protein